MSLDVAPKEEVGIGKVGGPGGPRMPGTLGDHNDRRFLARATALPWWRGVACRPVLLQPNSGHRQPTALKLGDEDASEQLSVPQRSDRHRVVVLLEEVH